MAKDPTITTFDQMLSTSTDIGNRIYDVSSEDIKVYLEDEDEVTYSIQDVKYNPDTKSIVIKFDHDE